MSCGLNRSLRQVVSIVQSNVNNFVLCNHAKKSELRCALSDTSYLVQQTKLPNHQLIAPYILATLRILKFYMYKMWEISHAISAYSKVSSYCTISLRLNKYDLLSFNEQMLSTYLSKSNGDVRAFKSRIASLNKFSIFTSPSDVNRLYEYCRALVQLWKDEHLGKIRGNITLVCRICGKKTNVNLINKHTSICKNLYHQRLQLKQIDDDILLFGGSLMEVPAHKKCPAAIIKETSSSFFDSKLDISDEQTNYQIKGFNISVCNADKKLNKDKERNATPTVQAFPQNNTCSFSNANIYKQIIINKSPAFHCLFRADTVICPKQNSIDCSPLSKQNKSNSSLQKTPDSSHSNKKSSRNVTPKQLLNVSRKLEYILEDNEFQNQKTVKALKNISRKAFSIKPSRHKLCIENMKSFIVSLDKVNLYINPNLKEKIGKLKLLLGSKLDIMQAILTSLSRLEFIKGDKVSNIEINKSTEKPISSLSQFISVSRQHQEPHITAFKSEIDIKTTEKHKIQQESCHSLECCNNNLEPDNRLNTSNLADYFPIQEIEKPLIYFKSQSDNTNKLFPKTHSDICISFNTSIKDFRIVKPLSRGMYGFVCLAQKIESEDYFAIKILDRRNVIEKNQIDFVKNEHDILKMMCCDFVVKCFYMFQNDRFLFFVLEYMAGGDLGSLLNWAGALYEEDARFYISQIIAAIETLHENNILHRDLKPDNILIDSEGYIKLADFGLSEVGVKEKYNPHNLTRKTNVSLPILKDIYPKRRSYKNIFDYKNESPKEKKEIKPIVGTPNYLAPEIIKGETQTYSLDWWSLGVIVYQMLLGYLPFQANSVEEIFSNIVNRKVNFPKIGTNENEISAQAYDLMYRLLDLNPCTRLGAHGVDEIKKHCFFKGVDWNNIKLAKPPHVPEVEKIEDTKFFNNQRSTFSVDEFLNENYDNNSNVTKDDSLLSNFTNTMIDSIADLNLQCAKQLISESKQTILK